MQIRDFIDFICHERQVTKRELAEQIGVNESTLYNTLSRNGGMGMKVSTLIKWLDALEYELVFEDLNADNDYLLDGEED